jgi:hypothetical protein
MPRTAGRWQSIWGTALVAYAVIAAGCQTTVPKDALKLSADSMQRRQLQTRKFEGVSERDILAASAGVLQDLGFNIDESETRLGVIVASKQRSAVETGQIVASVAFALLTGSAMPIDKTQKIRVSLVTRPASDQGDKTFFVRVTFQRIVWNTQRKITHIEAVDSPEIYQEFFEKLSKSVFLEAQKI